MGYDVITNDAEFEQGKNSTYKNILYFYKQFSHICFFTTKVGLLNDGKACWHECNKQQGPCSFCGTGLCCRKDYHDTSNGCGGTLGIDGYHVCDTGNIF